jgi:hypothetical protein
VQPVYSFDAEGGVNLALAIRGTAPINALDTQVEDPEISCLANTTGGSLAPGDYVVGLSAYDSGASNHANTDYLNLSVVYVQGSGAGSITVNVTWGSGDDGGDLYVAKWDGDGYVFHYNQTLAPGASSATITAFDESKPGGPDALFDHFGVAWLSAIHSGVWAQQVQAVTPTTITIAGSGMTVNQWAGYTLSLLAKFDDTVEIPILNMPVASNTASSGTPEEFVLTIGPNANSVQLPDLTTLLTVGDLVVMRTKATFTATSFSDLNIANPYYPSGATAVEAGHVAVVLSGVDTGDMVTVASVATDTYGNYTIFELAGSFKNTPAAGDIVIICAPSQVPEWPSPPILSRNSSLSGTMAQPDVTNLANQTWLFLVRTEDVNGVSGPDRLAPMRDIYFFGGGGTLTVSN